MAELRELAQIWEARGVEPELAMEVARQLTEQGRARRPTPATSSASPQDTAARPVQAALHVVGGVHPRRAGAAGGVPRGAGRRPLGARRRRRGRWRWLGLGWLGAVARLGQARSAPWPGSASAAPPPWASPSLIGELTGAALADLRPDWRRPPTGRHEAMTIAEPAPATTRGRHPHRLPHLPALRGQLRARDHAAAHRRRRRGGRAHPRRPRRRVQPGLHLPQGLHAQAAPRGPRPAAPAGGEARRRVRRGELGRGVRRDRAPACSRCSTSTAATPAAVYIGNPNAHNLAGMLYNRAVLRALGTTNVFSASTVDQRPKEISAALMFGGGLNVPVPDVDRTDHLLMLGANPYASNGSLATAPDWPGRLERLVERGGTVVVVDPRRSRTAEMATRVGADPPGRRRLPADGDGAGDHQRGPRRPRRAAPTSSPASTRSSRPRRRSRPRPWPHATGLDADVIRRLARELAAAPTACVYGRIGTTTAEFGTLTSWLVDVLNVLTGNLDRPGGAMFTKAAAGASNTRGKPRLRARGAPPPPHQPRARAARDLRRAPGGRAGRGDGHARARGRSAPSSPSPATRCSPRRTRRASTPPWRTSSAWCRSTSTSTRPPATPT